MRNGKCLFPALYYVGKWRQKIYVLYLTKEFRQTRECMYTTLPQLCWETWHLPMRINATKKCRILQSISSCYFFIPVSHEASARSVEMARLSNDKCILMKIFQRHKFRCHERRCFEKMLPTGGLVAWLIFPVTAIHNVYFFSRKHLAQPLTSVVREE